jgi:outer membrane lipoprotein-sorting protein
MRLNKNTSDAGEGPVTSSTEYNNYIDLGDGMKFALEMKTQAGAQTMNVRIGSVELNSAVEMSLFNLD